MDANETRTERLRRLANDPSVSLDDYKFCVEREDQKYKESLDLVISCAKDVVDYWPQFSFRTIRIMVVKMETLKQAIDMLK